MVIPKFLRLEGRDGKSRAAHKESIRLVQDAEDKGYSTVTLCDGTQFDVIGSVDDIIPLL